MDQHYKPLYEELIKEENFKKIMDLRSFYDDVLKPEIIIDFWKAVENKIQEECKFRDDLKGWKSQFLDDSIIYFYKEDWVSSNKEYTDDPTPFSIVWKQLDGKPFYCILIDKRVLLEYDKVRNLCPDFKIDGIALQYKDRNYIAWNYYNQILNFQAQSTLYDFLPSKREDRVNEFAKILIDLGKGCESYINSLINSNNFKIY